MLEMEAAVTQLCGAAELCCLSQEVAISSQVATTSTGPSGLWAVGWGGGRWPAESTV